MVLRQLRERDIGRIELGQRRRAIGSEGFSEREVQQPDAVVHRRELVRAALDVVLQQRDRGIALAMRSLEVRERGDQRQCQWIDVIGRQRGNGFLPRRAGAVSSPSAATARPSA